jgi:hypothetical protein
MEITIVKRHLVAKKAIISDHNPSHGDDRHVVAERVPISDEDFGFSRSRLKENFAVAHARGPSPPEDIFRADQK